MRVVMALLGAALTLLVLADLINAMLVPRGSYAPIARTTGRVITAVITTLGDPAWFMNQSRLVGGRRADLAVPVTLDTPSDAFRRWREWPGWDASGWESYAQES